MHYLIHGKLIRTNEVMSLPHEKLLELVKTRLVPTLQQIIEGKAQGKVLGGGVPAGRRECVILVDLPGDSHSCVRHFIVSLPIFDYFEWDVTALETFEEWLSGFGA